MKIRIRQLNLMIFWRSLCRPFGTLCQARAMLVLDRAIAPHFSKRLVAVCLVTLLSLFACLVLQTSPALAGIDDDRFDGNIFALYGGNGSLIPPRISLAESMNYKKPALLVFYIDDSSNCKQFAVVVNRLQAFYGRAASFIPIDVDAIPLKSSYSANEPGYYYQGVVPETILIDESGKVVYDGKGQVAFEEVDDAFRELFNLLPRSESVELKLRSFNEFNSELEE
ncbi:MAG: thylakoid membrane photosystem I accumulation factor [Oscillatoria sp. PMC 1068.18]|nr:thylakoid membrane photosystem I accumulation factor [Oscillatoria sp. PMC 1076.18]MEC4987233.1 thylakoid membrane photosystem I accumulation factor [Oscillatoria sp. PMC 1068.18]